jgi:pSer/pThr/pTyr-binding forkhead associated (FHA) protein
MNEGPYSCSAERDFPGLLGLAAQAATSTEAEFVGRFRGQYLVTECIHQDDMAWRSFTTSTVAAVRPGQHPNAMAVTPIAKRGQTNPYSWMITIGRTRNNDIVLADVSISKLHAWIRRKPDDAGVDRFTVTDAGSRNGTFIDGAPLRGETGQLPLGAHLRLGRVELVFVDGSMLYRAMLSLRITTSSAA